MVATSSSEHYPPGGDKKSAAARAAEATLNLKHELESLSRQLSADPPEVRRSKFHVVKERKRTPE